MKTSPLYRLDLPSYQTESEQVLERWANNLPLPEVAVFQSNGSNVTTVANVWANIGWTFDVTTSTPNATVYFNGSMSMTRAVNQAVFMRISEPASTVVSQSLTLNSGTATPFVAPFTASMVFTNPGKHTLVVQVNTALASNVAILAVATMTALILF
jgi:hypothetical protein